jgi:hypothetical protein
VRCGRRLMPRSGPSPREMSPSGDEQAGQVAMVISEVFRDPTPGAPVMLLEGLRAGIAG